MAAALYGGLNENQLYKPPATPLTVYNPVTHSTYDQAIPAPAGGLKNDHLSNSIKIPGRPESSHTASRNIIRPKITVKPDADTRTQKAAPVNFNASATAYEQTPNEHFTALIVRNLQWFTTETEIRQLFGQFGTIKRIKFDVDPANGISKGSCYIEFDGRIGLRSAYQAREKLHRYRMPMGKEDGIIVEFTTCLPGLPPPYVRPPAQADTGFQQIDPNKLLKLKALYTHLRKSKKRKRKRKIKRESRSSSRSSRSRSRRR